MTGFLVKRSRWVLASAAALALAAVPFALRLDVTTDLASLLPLDSPAVRSFREFEKQVGGHSYLSVFIESPDREANVRFGDALAERLARRGWAYQVQFRRETAFLRRRWPFLLSIGEMENLETELRDAVHRAKVKHSPLALDLSEEPGEPAWDRIRALARDAAMPLAEFRQNADGTAMLMQVQIRQLTSGVDKTRRILADAAADISALRPESYHPRLRARLYGGLRARLEEYNSILHDAALASLVTLPLILLIPALALRSVWQPLVVLVPVGIGMAWTYASAEFLFGSLNLVTSFLFLIIFGMGDDYPIHLLHRLREELARGGGLAGATRRALRSTAPPLFFAALTNLAGFASLAWMHFRGFSQFGIIAGMGVCFILAATLLTVPGLAALIGKRLQVGQVPDLPVTGSSRTCPNPPLRWSCVLPAVCAWTLLVAGSAWFAYSKLGLETDFERLRPDFPELRELRSKAEVLGYQKSTPAVFFTADYEASRAITRQVEARRDGEGERSPIGRVYSLASMVDGLTPAKRECAERIRELLSDGNLRPAPADLREAARRMRDFDLRPMAIEGIPESARRAFTRPGVSSESGDIYLVVVEARNRVSVASEALAFAARLEGVEAGGRTFVPAGESLVMADILLRVRREGWRTLLLAWLAAAAVIYLAFRSWTEVAVLLATVGGAIVICLAVLAAAGVRLNYFNLTVLPLLVGLGIDYGIHILHRYHEEGLPARHAARKLAAAVGSAAATTAVGFAGLLLARHPGLWSMGFTASIGIAATAASCVLVLPSLADFTTLAEGWWRSRAAHARPLPHGPVS
ncbi:MAG: MMPL family transporter [Acidobacteriia bacterium]|nr:MMPL family transporter [Terriglobia bacterium]